MKRLLHQPLEGEHRPPARWDRANGPSSSAHPGYRKGPRGSPQLNAALRASNPAMDVMVQISSHLRQAKANGISVGHTRRPASAFDGKPGRRPALLGWGFIQDHRVRRSCTCAR